MALSPRSSVNQEPGVSRIIDLSPAQKIIDDYHAPFVAAGAAPGETGTALTKAGNLSGRDPSNVPINVAHNARAQIGDMIDTASPSAGRYLTQIHDAITHAMPPDYQAVSEQYAKLKQALEAMQATNDVVQKGLI